jgi:hypothetical protein
VSIPPLPTLPYPSTYRQLFLCPISPNSTYTSISVMFYEHVFTLSELAPLGFMTQYDTDSDFPLHSLLYINP